MRRGRRPRKAPRAGVRLLSLTIRGLIPRLVAGLSRFAQPPVSSRTSPTLARLEGSAKTACQAKTGAPSRRICPNRTQYPVAIDRDKLLQSAAKLVEKKRYDKAVLEYQKVVQHDPKDARTLLKIGDLYSRLKDFASAVATY